MGLLIQPIPRYRPDIPVYAILQGLLKTCFLRNARGECVKTFERAFAEKMGSRHAVALSSVRFGLYSVIESLGLSRDSEILCTPLTIYSIIPTLIQAGLRPIFVDITQRGFSMDMEDAARKLTPRTKAILVTHLWGMASDISRIAGFAREHGLILLEDASQCLNGEIGSKKTGTIGTAGFFSFSMTKTINTYHGAIMVTDDSRLAKDLSSKVSRLAPCGRTRLLRALLAELALWTFTRPIPFSLIFGPLQGFLQRLGVKDYLDNRNVSCSPQLGAFPSALETSFTDIQAEPGLMMLETLDAFDCRRRRIADIYFKMLRGLPDLQLPERVPGSTNNFWMFTVCVPERRKLKEFLWRRKKIDCTISSVDPCHEMPIFGELRASLPMASQFAQRALYLPAYLGMVDEEVRRVARSVIDFFKRQDGTSQTLKDDLTHV
ncbi:GDP-perosamine synthase [subsurface metagenome]